MKRRDFLLRLGVVLCGQWLLVEQHLTGPTVSPFWLKVHVVDRHETYYYYLPCWP